MAEHDQQSKGTSPFRLSAAAQPALEHLIGVMIPADDDLFDLPVRGAGRLTPLRQGASQALPG
jgi:hypothetical protein